jgi:hypothetical protein
VRGHAVFDCAVCLCVLRLAHGVAAVAMVLFVDLLSTAGLVVVAVVLVVTLALVPLVPMVNTVVSSVVATTVLAKFCSSWIVVQVVISLPKGVVIVADAMARVWSTITGNARGPVPTKQAINRVGCDCVPPNLAQLCVQRIVLFGPASRTTASISLVSVLILWSRVVVGARACVNAFMFKIALLMPARFLRCCAQLFERMAIFLLVFDRVAIL